MEKYDIIIIGGGPGGYTAGIRAALKGARVAVVEADKLGGVCLNRGCIPSKALIASAVQYRKMQESDKFGIQLASPPVIDWSAMRARKDKIVGGFVSGIGHLFKSHGVDHIPGFGRISNPNEVIVTDSSGGESTLSTDNIIIATGSRAADLPGLEFDGNRIINSDHLLELGELPDSILIIGAGVIGCEWGFMLSYLDVEVVMVEMLDHALPMEDVNSSALIERELKKLKVELRLNTRVNSVVPDRGGIKAVLSDGDSIEADKVLVSVGRAFNTDKLGLEAVGVQIEENGSIKVDSHTRTTVNNIFAIGDVAGESLLAYTAVHDGTVAVDNALGGDKTKNYASVPSVIFTHPEVASVGLKQDEAAAKYDVGIGKFPFRALGKAHGENEIAGEVMVIGDKKTDKLLGVHIVGDHATELIHTAALAIGRGLTVTELGEMIFAHPVMSEAIMEAAHDFHQMAVHLAKKK